MPDASRIRIPVPGEGFDLEGRLNGQPGGPCVVVCHPHPAFGGTLDAPLIVALTDALALAGMRVLRFNFRGIGDSGGRPEGGLVEERDVRAACAWLRAQSRSDSAARSETASRSESASRSETETDLAIAAYSFGALMAAKALATGEHARRFAAIGFPTRIIGRDPSRIAHVETALAATPTLFIGGDRDQFCEADRLREWAAAIPQTRIHLIPGADHFPSGAPLTELLDETVSFLR